MGDIGWSTAVLAIMAAGTLFVVLAVIAAMQAGRSIERAGTSGSRS